MKTVWKFPIPTQDGIIDILMPKNAEILHVADQYGQICLWALVDSDAEKVIRKFRIYGTGHPLVVNAHTGYNTYDTYVGTAMQLDGKLLWHIFEVK